MRCCSYSCIKERSKRSPPEIGADLRFLSLKVSRLGCACLRYASRLISTKFVSVERKFATRSAYALDILRLMSSMNCICAASCVVSWPRVANSCSLAVASVEVRIWSIILSLWSLDNRRLFKHDSEAMPNVDRKLVMEMFSLVMYSILTKSLCCTDAGGPER